MAARLRVGIIGLGPTWRRYRLVLRRLRDLFDVRCLYDQHLLRAEMAARRLGCGVAAGPVSLLDRPEIEALFLFDPQWFGLWPLVQACRLGKPVFCASSLVKDDAHADALARTASPATVMMAPNLLALPALARLQASLQHRLGPARLVHCDYRRPRRKTAPSTAQCLRWPALLSLLQECASIFGTDPVSVWSAPALTGAASVFLEFGEGRSAQINLWTGFGVHSHCQVRVVAENGGIEAVLPRVLRWQDREGRHKQRLPKDSLHRRMLEQFYFAIRVGEKPRPDLLDAHKALTWLRAAIRSLDEGKRVVLAGKAASGDS
jgi:predicted dehydrogenase